MAHRGILDEDDTQDDPDELMVDFRDVEQAYKCCDCGEEGSGRVTRHGDVKCIACGSENLVTVD